MAWKYSVLEHDEVLVDEEYEEVCAECGEMTWDDELSWDDDVPFCEPCFTNIFGEDK